MERRRIKGVDYVAVHEAEVADQQIAAELAETGPPWPAIAVACGPWPASA
jgi:hypothetical protein